MGEKIQLLPIKEFQWINVDGTNERNEKHRTPQLSLLQVWSAAKVNGRKFEEKQGICFTLKGSSPREKMNVQDKQGCPRAMSVQSFPLKYALWFQRQVNWEICLKLHVQDFMGSSKK